MEIKQLSKNKITLTHRVPMYYRCGSFVSDKIGEKRVVDKWVMKSSDVLYTCGFKRRFRNSLIKQFSPNLKNIVTEKSYKNFEFEEGFINLATTDRFYFEITEVEVREYKLKRLLN